MAEMFEGDLAGVFTSDPGTVEETEVEGGEGEVSDVTLVGMPIEMDVTEETIHGQEQEHGQDLQDQGEEQELITDEGLGLEGQVNFSNFQVIQPPVEELSLEDQLKSTERLDRSSPDLWPQNLPTAAQQIISQNLLKTGLADHLGIWAQGLDPEDINLLHQFGSLTSSSLVEEVKKLQNIAYQLGLDEAKEMTRGKLLHALMEENFSAKEGRHIKRLWN